MVVQGLQDNVDQNAIVLFSQITRGPIQRASTSLSSGNGNRLAKKEWKLGVQDDFHLSTAASCPAAEDGVCLRARRTSGKILQIFLVCLALVSVFLNHVRLFQKLLFEIVMGFKPAMLLYFLPDLNFSCHFPRALPPVVAEEKESKDVGSWMSSPKTIFPLDESE